MTFKDYFDAYDDDGVLHAGFLQSMDFSGISQDITMLNDLTMAMMDAYLFNEFSSAIVMRNWRKYMEYNREEERLEVKSEFYANFVKALYGYLAKSQKWYELTKTDFTSLSATDIKTLEHGKKETEKDYGATQTTKEYGAGQITRAYGAGQITRAYGAGQKTNVHGAQSVTRDYDRVVVTLSREDDTHIVGAAHTEGTGSRTGLVYPLGASAYVDDTKQTESTEQDTDEQTNTEKYGDQETTTAARQDEESKGAYTDTESSAAKTDTESEAAKTDTESSAAKTDRESSTARKDTEEIKAYTDTERRTRFIVISPDKYFEISKELADIGVYDLMKCAVKDTMLLNVWDGGDCYDDHIL